MNYKRLHDQMDATKCPLIPAETIDFKKLTVRSPSLPFLTLCVLDCQFFFTFNNVTCIFFGFGPAEMIIVLKYIHYSLMTRALLGC